MRQALADTDWQRTTAARLKVDRDRLLRLLGDAGLAPRGSAPLFVYCPHDNPRPVADALAEQGVLVRVFEGAASAALWSSWHGKRMATPSASADRGHR